MTNVTLSKVILSKSGILSKLFSRLRSIWKGYRGINSENLESYKKKVLETLEKFGDKYDIDPYFLDTEYFFYLSLPFIVHGILRLRKTIGDKPPSPEELGDLINEGFERCYEKFRDELPLHHSEIWKKIALDKYLLDIYGYHEVIEKFDEYLKSNPDGNVLKFILKTFPIWDPVYSHS